MKKKRIICLFVVVIMMVALFTGCSGKSEEITSTEAKTTETTTEEPTTEKSYPPAEEFNAYEISFYEKDNEVKRNEYLKEIYKKRFVFYLEVGKVEGKQEISGQLYPDNSFSLDKTKGQKIYSTLYNSYHFPAGMTKEDYITYLYYSCSLTFVDFDEEIWETLEKGDKIVIEASIDGSSSITDLDYIGFGVKLIDAVLISPT